RFLRFTVERAVAGDADSLKEYTLALEVFDRPQDYDPKVDSVVRVEARRLRQKLDSYYRGDGSRDRIRISYPHGAYVPAFELLAVSPERRGIAVLPFVSMSADPEQNFFCDGLTEQLIAALSAVDGLKVVARTSVFQFKGVAIDVRDI